MHFVPVMVFTNCKGSLSLSVSFSVSLLVSLSLLVISLLTLSSSLACLADVDAAASSLSCLVDVDATIPGGSRKKKVGGNIEITTEETDC